MCVVNKLLCFALISVSALASAASATQYLLVLSGPMSARIVFDKPATPTSFTPAQAVFDNYFGTYNGVREAALRLTFSNDAEPVRQPVFSIMTRSASAQFTGMPLIGSSVSRPIFAEGHYDLVDANHVSSSLAISELPAESPPVPPSPVPEPSTWAMMIGGFLLTSIAARRRRTAPA